MIEIRKEEKRDYEQVYLLIKKHLKKLQIVIKMNKN